MLEAYAAYWDYRDNMRFTQTLIQNLLKKVTGSQEIEYQGQKIDFSGELDMPLQVLFKALKSFISKILQISSLAMEKN